MSGHQLSDIIGEYLAAMTTADKASTVRNKRQTLNHLLTTVGNIQTRNVTGSHIDQFFTAMQKKAHSPGTMNGHLYNLRHFFAWTCTRRYRPQGDMPTLGRKPLKVPERARLRIPAAKFPDLLNAAPHARDRIVVALGLYLFLRQGEVGLLKVGDVNLERGEIQVTIEKTSQFDTMPICTELDVELRRWLTFYTEACGIPERDWYLAPAKSIPKWVGTAQGVFEHVDEKGNKLNPSRKMVKIEECVHRALVNAGYPIRDAAGKSTMEGGHTLRRSGARALFDELLERGYDGALRQVQAMLHHKSSTMTEHYLGIDLDVKRRNEALRGRAMFAAPNTDNVVRLAVSE